MLSKAKPFAESQYYHKLEEAFSQNVVFERKTCFVQQLGISSGSRAKHSDGIGDDDKKHYDERKNDAGTDDDSGLKNS